MDTMLSPGFIPALKAGEEEATERILIIRQTVAPFRNAVYQSIIS